MSKINIFLLDNMNNIKEELYIIKPISYKEFLFQITQKFKIIQDKYELFILDKTNKEIKINILILTLMKLTLIKLKIHYLFVKFIKILLNNQ